MRHIAVTFHRACQGAIVLFVIWACFHLPTAGKHTQRTAEVMIAEVSLGPSAGFHRVSGPVLLALVAFHRLCTGHIRKFYLSSILCFAFYESLLR